MVLYISGTTGHPKGAELRHRNVYDNALIGGDLFVADPGRPDTYLCVLPLFHAFGQSVIQNGAFAFGSTIVMQPGFEARAALRLMLAHDVTFFAGAPTMYGGLLAALDETVDVARLAANLRVAVAGGSALPAETHKQVKGRFGVTILEGYGLSETSPIASFSRFGGEPRVGSIGVPIPGVEMRLIRDDWSEVEVGPDEIGEIAIKRHNVAWAKERLAAYKYPRVEPDPDHVLVQSAASDAESASAFHEPALAHVWTHIPPEQPHKPGQREVLMRFLLDRRRLCAPGLARARDTTGQRLLRPAP